MKKYGLLVLFVSLLFVQCADMEKYEPYRFDKQQSVVFKNIHLDDSLGVTMQIKKIGEQLFLNDFYGDSLIKVFNLQTGKLERCLVSKGEGPGELMSPLDMYFVDKNIYLLSRPVFQLNHLSLDSVLQNKKCMLHKDYQMPPKSDRFLPLTTTQFVFSGLWDKRYTYLNLEVRDSLQEFGEYPDYWEDEKTITPQVKAMFHQCMFGKHPNKNLFVSCSYYVLEIYGYNASEPQLPTLLFRKQLGKYSYDYTSGEVLTATKKKDSDPCVTELACSGSCIYLVVQSEENRKHRNVMVIDWEGNPLKLLKTDKRITCLSIDEKENRGYCIIEEPEDTLVSFEL